MTPFDPATVSRLVDPLAFALVGGGSFAVAALHGTLGDLKAAWAALGRLFGRGYDPEGARAEIARLERVVRRHGLLAIETEAVADPAIARAMQMLVDGVPEVQVRAHLAAARAERAARAGVAQLYWSTVAEIAPAMGMIGTVIGLIGMFANMGDAAKVGPGMALALITTLYGAALANLVAAPIASRLWRAQQAEEDGRAMVEPFVLALAAADRAPPARRAAAA